MDYLIKETIDISTMVKPRGPTTPIGLAVMAWLAGRANSFLSSSVAPTKPARQASSFLHMSTASATTLPSWTDLASRVATTPVGQALNQEVELRKQGRGSAHVQNKLRKFDSDKDPKIILYRDHAGW